jgi:hypothetical protein
MQRYLCKGVFASPKQCRLAELKADSSLAERGSQRGRRVGFGFNPDAYAKLVAK